MATITRRVSASPDDFYTLNGGIFNSGQFLTATGAYSTTFYGYNSGLRFQGIQVPQGVVIENAYLTFVSFANDLGTACYTRFYGEAADNAARVIDFEDYVARSRTAQYVNWTPPGWYTNNSYNSPELKSIIQEIVNRGGWVPGNALSLFWQDNNSVRSSPNYRKPYSYDGDPNKAALLTITYYSPPVELAAQPTIELATIATLDTVPPTIIDIGAQSSIELSTVATLETIFPPVELAAQPSIEVNTIATLDAFQPEPAELAAQPAIEFNTIAALDSVIEPGWWIAREAITEDTPNSVVGIVGIQRDGVWYWSEESAPAIVRHMIELNAPTIYSKPLPMWLTGSIMFPAKNIYLTPKQLRMSRLQVVVAIGIKSIASATVRAQTSATASIGIKSIASAVVRARTVATAVIGILAKVKAHIAFIYDDTDMENIGFSFFLVDGIDSLKEAGEAFIIGDPGIGALGNETIELEPMVVYGDVRGQGWQDLRDKLREIRKVVDKRSYAQLRFVFREDLFYDAIFEKMVVKNTGWMKRRVELRFMAKKYCKSTTETIVSLPDGTGQLQVNNIGDVAAVPVFTATITQSLDEIYIEAGGIRITMTDDLINGDVVVVDCEKQTTTKNGLFADHKISGNYPRINAGVGIVGKTASGVSLEATYRIRRF